MIRSGHVAEPQLITLSPEFVARYNELAARPCAEGDVAELQKLQQENADQAARYDNEIRQLELTKEALVAELDELRRLTNSHKDQLDAQTGSHKGQLNAVKREVDRCKSDYTRALEERDEALEKLRAASSEASEPDPDSQLQRKNKKLAQENDALRSEVRRLTEVSSNTDAGNSSAESHGSAPGSATPRSEDRQELLGQVASLLQERSQLVQQAADPECNLDRSAVAELPVEHLQSLVSLLEAETAAVGRRQRQNRALNRQLKRGRGDRRRGAT